MADAATLQPVGSYLLLTKAPAGDRDDRYNVVAIGAGVDKTKLPVKEGDCVIATLLTYWPAKVDDQDAYLVPASGIMAIVPCDPA